MTEHNKDDKKFFMLTHLSVSAIAVILHRFIITNKDKPTGSMEEHLVGLARQAQKEIEEQYRDDD